MKEKNITPKIWGIKSNYIVTFSGKRYNDGTYIERYKNMGKLKNNDISIKKIGKGVMSILGAVFGAALLIVFIVLAHQSALLSWVNDDLAKQQITEDIQQRYSDEVESIQYISSTGVVYFGFYYDGWDEDVNYQYKITLSDGSQKTMGYTCYKNWPNPQFCSLWDAGGQ